MTRTQDNWSGRYTS
ncbi:hypothetical protein TIFTF001_029063 [Ficus carica]|uniref:Uncharacterized protein n=1 Tax=Ficus carica TaxID=3494 RepID=A0AA88DRQ6_FICCA|nr:hypothetical protein TIFTF001_029063 [Ficus carica]